jgi:hypothetical protein
MAEEKKEVPMNAALLEFRKKLMNKDALKETILDGLKNKSAKVRSLAVKTAFRLKDHDLVKKNILPLIKSDKSKKVLRTVADKITRKELTEKVRKLMAQKKAAPKAKEEAPAAAAPAAPAAKT